MCMLEGVNLEAFRRVERKVPALRRSSGKHIGYRHRTYQIVNVYRVLPAAVEKYEERLDVSSERAYNCGR